MHCKTSTLFVGMVQNKRQRLWKVHSGITVQKQSTLDTRYKQIKQTNKIKIKTRNNKQTNKQTSKQTKQNKNKETKQDEQVWPKSAKVSYA